MSKKLDEFMIKWKFTITPPDPDGSHGLFWMQTDIHCDYTINPLQDKGDAGFDRLKKEGCRASLENMGVRIAAALAELEKIGL